MKWYGLFTTEHTTSDLSKVVFHKFYFSTLEYFVSYIMLCNPLTGMKWFDKIFNGIILLGRTQNFPKN